MTAPTRRRASRGNGAALGPEVLAATMDLLRETGDADAVSLRKVADRVGVSVPSIYLHFADKQALLDAVCDRVFGDLDLAMRQASADAPNAWEALRLQGVAYVRFALDNPEHYRIVMMGTSDHDGATEIAGGAFAHLFATIEQCLEIGVLEGDPLTLALQLWSAAHGIAALMVSKPALPWPPLEEFVDRTICGMGSGLAVLSRMPQRVFDDPPPAEQFRDWFDRLRD